MLWWIWQQLPLLHGKTVMELGGGLAVPSQTLSQLGVAARVIATDTDALLMQQLRNSSAGTPLEVYHLNWAAPDQLSASQLSAPEESRDGEQCGEKCEKELEYVAVDSVAKVDVIIGTDIIYKHDHLQDLALTMAYWLKKDGKAVLINNRKRSEQAGFVDIVRSTPGLKVELVTPLAFPLEYTKHSISNGLAGSEVLSTGRLANLEFELLEIRRL
jgi:predicted nicotinamide N-methyase